MINTFFKEENDVSFNVRYQCFNGFLDFGMSHEVKNTRNSSNFRVVLIEYIMYFLNGLFLSECFFF